VPTAKYLPVDAG